MLLWLTLVSTLLASLVVAENDADVLILGAGMAGQTAAEYFMKKNVSFLVIEGAAEPGGRVKSEMFGGRMVEMGSNGIYAMNSTKQQLIDMYNISGMYTDYESVVIRLPNGSQPDTEAEAAWGRLMESQEKVAALYGEMKGGKMTDVSIRVALEYGNWFPKNSIDDVIEIYDYDYEFAKIPEEMSTYGFESARPYQEMPYLSNDQRGLQKIFEMIPRDDSILKLNEVVTKISDTGSSVVVTTNSGKNFTGKYVIVTFSMGVLKSGSVTFEPVLPAWKLSTIYKTSMDPYTQVYVVFPEETVPYWGTEQYVLYASPRRGYYPILWNLKAGDLSSAGKPMIVFHVTGEEARRVERESKETIKAEVTDVLKKMYGSGVAEPDDILVTRWNENPLTMGSFSSRQVGDNSPMNLDALKAPVGRIYFAGDAYNDIIDGFLVGAFASGNSTAMMVHNCMMDKNCPMFNPDAYKPVPPKPVTCGAACSFVTVTLLITCLATIFL